MERDTIKQYEAALLYVYTHQQQSVYINLIDCKVSLSLGKPIYKKLLLTNKQKIENRIQGHI